MLLLDKITVHHKSGDRYIELCEGDLTDIPPEHAVDVLVVSAFPNNYGATRGTLIGALDRKGLSVKELSEHKATDLRENFSCWLSQEIAPTAESGLRFKRILCFEPLVRGRPSELVGDIFLSITPFVMANSDITRIAMPLVATGKQADDPIAMLNALVDASVHWLAVGLPVTHIKIVEYDQKKALQLESAFSVLKQKYQAPQEPLIAEPEQFKYDLFISYSHENTDEVLFLLEGLHQLHPSLRVFLDRRKLNVGSAWQQEIYEALDDCRKVIAVYSPSYLASKVCKEEFNIALFRHRESEDGTLIPIYLTSTALPTYMKIIQFIDCREADRDKLKVACQEILSRIG
ncbi:MAG: toll/interleukin-1 receptor domain-containing protein [Chloroflexota bacterium]